MPKKGNIPWNKGQRGVIHLSEETKQKMSIGHKGQKQWNTGLTKETDERVRRRADKIRGRPSPFKGIKKSEEQRLKNSLAHKGQKAWNKGVPRSEETKAKISKTKTGVKYGPMPEEHKKKISLVLKGNHPSPIKGKTRPKFSLEWCRHISEGTKGIRKGEKNPNWKGGMSLESYGELFTWEFKKEILARDNYQCVLCGIKKSKNNQLVIHHIDYNKKNNHPMNLITLCRHCHMKTNFNRKYWQSFFGDLMCFYFPEAVRIYNSQVHIDIEEGNQP